MRVEIRADIIRTVVSPKRILIRTLPHSERVAHTPNLIAPRLCGTAVAR